MKYWHLTLATILLISLPAIALTNMIIVNTSDDQILDANRSMMEGLASDLEEGLYEHLMDREALLHSITEAPNIDTDATAVVDDFYGGDPAPVERERITEIIEARSIGPNRGATIVMLDPDYGAIILGLPDEDLEGYVPLNSTVLARALDSPSRVYLPSLPWVAHPSIALTEPVKNDAGATMVVFVALVQGSELAAQLDTNYDLGDDGGVYLVGPDGRLFTSGLDGQVAGNITTSKGAWKALEGSSGFHVTENSDRVLEVYEYVNDWDLAMLVEMDAAEGESGLRVVQMSAAAAGAIVAGALVVIAVVLSKNLNRDLGSLVSWSKDVGEGKWDAPLELGPTDEFQDLEYSFKQMVRDMVKHQSQMRVAERRFSSLFINSLDPVYIARSDGRIQELNPAGEGVLGLPRQDDGTYGYSLEELFVDGGARREFIGRLEREGAVAGFEARILLPSGRELFVLISAVRRMDDAGRTVNYQGVIHDITDRKRFEEALVEAKNDSEFYCDIMSHDLNNAVQGLGGYLELCNLANDLDDVNQFLPYAHEQMARASDLLRNVRRLSHLGSQDVELKDMDLRKILVKSVWAVERAHAHEKIDFRLDLPDEDPMVLGEAFVEDVFINLMDNAVKYDPHDERIVDVQVTKVEVDGTDRWRVRVADRGPGVADRDKQTIFGRFERRALKEYGTGLGLSIVVKAVERSNGRTWVEDRVPGDHTQGAAFVVELMAA
jgi:PAS domain S-box-containing protein